MSCPDLVSDYINPATKWYQTDLHVVINIQLMEVSDYYLQIENDCLQFSTETNGKKYYLILYLYGAVVPEKTAHKNFGREIRIYLVKALKWFSWRRLITSKEKHIYISYDLDHIMREPKNATTFDIHRFQRYKKENNIQYIMPAMSSSEDDSDDSDMDNDFYH
ncbi:hypothetical protein PUN28_016451 [Cardiocondyla obscurior]|uniref:CS domain-containing protein n=2 Tax=Cardiocondyla obscurior TaxID=286306 RepID=A0AAW2ET11_9HYME